MKKLVLLMSLMLIAFCSGYALSADEIVGKWESSPIKQEAAPGDPMTTTLKLIYNFAADNTVKTNCEMNLTLMLDKGMYADIFMDISLKGNYEVAGDSITVNYIPGEAIVTFTEDDVRIRGIEDADMEAMVKENIFAGLSQQKDEMTKDFGTEPDIINSVTVAGNKMFATMEDMAVTFKRKKK